ncbi:MAG: three-Cys-motif partner protein TcmP [Bacteroidetes bacterium]|nr:three-Cys-motif partner protein TcmP [Bacteroidota bacterium]
MAKSESQTSLFEHSEAKIKLYGKYLSIYLNVLARSTINNIYLFDLFCGEGIYKDGGKGSPIVALETIKNHYYANGEKCPNIFVTFNDTELSEVEEGKFKIDRVKEFADKIFRPQNVKVGYTRIDFNQMILKVSERIKTLKTDERALIFIDPWGYKEIDPEDIKKIMENGKAEIILFLPIYFMSRFVNKSKDIDFKGGRALREFMIKLFGNIDDIPHIGGQKDFIYSIQLQFKRYLNLKYVDCFKIERESNNWFSIFFFTQNKKGFHKMLDAKWSLDKKRGDSFKIGDEITIELFDELEITGYKEKVFNFLKNNANATNADLLEFGLENNFLPKHTKSVLDEINKQHSLQLISLDKKEARSYYIGDEKRFVNIRLKI